jgi:hypothetical protein
MLSRRGTGLAWVLAIASCGGEARREEPEPQPQTQTTAEAPPVAEPVRCADPIPHLEGGVEIGAICRDVAVARGLTILDLSEKWAPRPFSPVDHPPPKFRDTYLLLAGENDPDGGELAPEEKLVEMYGISPAPSVILRRLGADRRHACHAAIDNSALARVHRVLSEAPNSQVDAADRKRKRLGVRLEKERRRKKLPDIATLGLSNRWKHEVVVWQRLQDEHDAVLVTQKHMVCEGLMTKKFVDGWMTWMTARALDFYQRAHFLLPDQQLDADTRAALAAGELEHDFRAALRLLRERVVDATGLIEDGTAGEGPVPVLGRELSPDTMQRAKGRKALPNGAPDLIGAATERAALAIGWTTPEHAMAFMARHRGEALEVAVALPPPPAYHGPHMDLHVVIDRGDVWYELQARHHTAARRPSLVLYARDGEVDRPLVQWPTTIGGWADQIRPGGRIEKQWKESDVGPRVWKQMYVAPTWQPPRTTPDDDLVKNMWNGKWRLRSEVLGPGARSAYGMVMLINHKVVKVGKKRVAYADNGIRVHGSASVTSVIRGSSHGCHRLLNHLAVRLGSFLLRHRDHVVEGDQKAYYRRIVRSHGVFEAKVKTRGYLYELTPPVQVEVTAGRIRSARKRPPPKSFGVAP